MSRLHRTGYGRSRRRRLETVRCSSGAEYCIGDTMFGKPRAHVSEMQRYHEAAKERRADKMFAMLLAGDNANRTPNHGVRATRIATQVTRSCLRYGDLVTNESEAILMTFARHQAPLIPRSCVGATDRT